MTRHALPAALLLAALAGAPPALAGAVPPPALAPDASNASLPTALQNLGVLSGVVNSRTAAYTVQNSDQGGTIALGGNAFYALTVNAPASYTHGSRFYFVVTNIDTGRAKSLALNGLSYMLWPGQSRLVFPDGTGSWQCAGGCFRRWKVPSGTVNVYTDYTNGSDSGNDCLATGAGNACKTVGGLLNNLVNDQFDFNGSDTGQTQLTINMAANSSDLSRVHWSPHGNVGAQGGAAITVDGGGTATLAGDASGATLQIYYGGILRLQNLIVTSQTGQDCSDIQDGGVLDVGPGTVWNCSNGNVLRAVRGGDVYIEGGFSVGGVGGNSYVLAAGVGGVVALPGSGQTITLTANLTGKAFIEADTGGAVYLNHPTFSLGSNTFTGLQATVTAATINVNGATVPGSGNTTLTGGTFSTNGSALTVSAGGTGATILTNKSVLYGQGGGLIGNSAHTGNNGLVVTTSSGFPDVVLPVTVASLPGCAAGNAGAIEAVSDALAPTYGGTLTGGGSIYAIALCNGTAWVAH